MRVLLLHETQHDVAALEDVLCRDGCHVRSIRANALTMASEIEAWPADVLLIAADDPTRDMVEQICVASIGRERAIVMFTEDDDPHAMRTIVQAGVSAYVVSGCAPARLRTIINVALERFAYEQSLFKAHRLAAQKEAEARVIAQAKAKLQRTGMSEPDAYKHLRDRAMRERRTIAEVACTVMGVNTLSIT